MSLLSAALDLVAVAVAASPAFQTLTGSADAAAAAALVVRLDQPTPADGPHALVRLPRDPVSRAGAGFLAKVAVEVALVLPPDGQADHLALAAAVAALDALAADLREATGLRVVELDTVGVERAAADEGDLAGWHVASLRLTLLGAV